MAHPVTWTQTWIDSAGRRVVVIDALQRVVHGVVVEAGVCYPQGRPVCSMLIKLDDGSLLRTHPRYARPEEPWDF